MVTILVLFSEKHMIGQGLTKEQMSNFKMVTSIADMFTLIIGAVAATLLF